MKRPLALIIALVAAPVLAIAAGPGANPGAASSGAELFEKLDTNKDGYISKQEALVSKEGMQLNFAALDKNRTASSRRKRLSRQPARRGRPARRDARVRPARCSDKRIS